MSAGVEPRILRFFADRPELARSLRAKPLVVAFSGGPDSTALLLALRSLASRLGVRPHAVHVDHRLDEGSGRRAVLALRIAQSAGAPFDLRVARRRPSGWSIEEWARAERYRLLASAMRRLGAPAVAAAHHRFDQAETVLLRILDGSGVLGLRAMAPVSTRLGFPLLRPLLELDAEQLRRYVKSVGTMPVDDPTNRMLRHRRNFIRQLLWPRLAAAAPDLLPRLEGLADAARDAERTVHRLLDAALEPRPAAESCEVDVGALLRLASPLWPAALARLHHLAGAPYPPTGRSRSELRRQLEGRRDGHAVGCDCGGGWRWELDRGRLRVCRPDAGGAYRQKRAGIA